MKFEFATATRIVFGAGTVNDAGAIAKKFGRRALVVTGRDSRRAERILAGLKSSGVGAVTFSVAGEPELETVERGTKLARAEHCELVIGFGGGSALDAAKAIAAMLTNEGGLLDYVEIIGRGRPLTKLSAPFIAIPTTAGTGTEVTRNAVLASPEHKLKVSLRSPLMLARVAMIDPELTYDLPPALTASTGLDALTQLIEPFVCNRANPMTDGLCVEGLRRAARSLRVAFSKGQDQDAREDMAVASLFGGLALANAGLGAVHGFAGPIGGRFFRATRRDLRGVAAARDGDEPPRVAPARSEWCGIIPLRRGGVVAYRRYEGQSRRRREMGPRTGRRFKSSAPGQFWD